MQGNVSLRGLEYLHSHDEEKSLPMLVASGLADHLLVQPEAKRFALAQDTLHDDPSETLTAVETAKGVLLFEYSGFGKTCCHAYMQHLADRFFITDEEKPEDRKSVSESGAWYLPIDDDSGKHVSCR